MISVTFQCIDKLIVRRNSNSRFSSRFSFKHFSSMSLQSRVYGNFTILSNSSLNKPLNTDDFIHSLIHSFVIVLHTNFSCVICASEEGLEGSCTDSTMQQRLGYTIRSNRKKWWEWYSNISVGNPSLGNLSYNIREHNVFTERWYETIYTDNLL